jgi:hypothetical protein
MGFPEPEDLTSLVLRTDFSNDGAWRGVQMAIDASDDTPCATYVSDPVYAKMDIQALVEVDAAADAKVYYLFLADAVTMADEEHPLLAVDLADEPGRTFRVPAREYGEVSANLCISNMDFADFADDVDSSGTYRS